MKKKTGEGHGLQEWGEVDTTPCDPGIPNSPAGGRGWRAYTLRLTGSVGSAALSAAKALLKDVI